MAYQWASRIMVVALEMVLPGLAGHWLDKQLGTVVLFLLVGLGLGCTAAVVPFDSDDSRDRDTQRPIVATHSS